MTNTFLKEIGYQKQMQEWKGGNPAGDDDGDGTKNSRDADWKDYDKYQQHIKSTRENSAIDKGFARRAVDHTTGHFCKTHDFSGK